MRHASSAAPHRQRGFAAVFAAVAMVAMLSAVALSIDVGRLYTAKRELQRAANLSALDAVQQVSGCNGRGVGSQADALREAASSLKRNDLQGATLQAAVGMRSTGGGNGLAPFTPLPDGDGRISAVQVTLTQPAPQRLIPMITGESDLKLQATAAASQAPQAGVSIGPSALSLDSTSSPVLNLLLGGLLGGNINLSVASQRGLASAQVKLSDLVAAAGVATPKGLVDINTSLPNALRLLQRTLNRTGGAVNSTAAATLQTLAAIADPSRTVLLGSVLQLGETVTGIDDADTLYVDALSLLLALSQSAAVGRSLDLPVNVALPAGLANLKLTLKVVDAPLIRFPGPAGFGADGKPLTFARSAALQLQLRADVLDVRGALAGLSPLVGVVLQPVRLGLDVDLGAAEAYVSEIHCPTAKNPSTTADIEVNTQLARVRLGTFSGAAASLPPLTGGPLINAINLPLLQFPVLSVALTAPATLDVGRAGEDRASFIDDFPLQVVLPTPTNPRLVGDEMLLGSAGFNLGAEFANKLQVRLLNIPLPLSETLSLTSGLLTPLFATLDAVVDPLLSQLGVQPGAAQVSVYQVKVPRAEVFFAE